jgi:hypothetical protein
MCTSAGIWPELSSKSTLLLDDHWGNRWATLFLLDPRMAPHQLVEILEIGKHNMILPKKRNLLAHHLAGCRATEFGCDSYSQTRHLVMQCGHGSMHEIVKCKLIASWQICRWLRSVYRSSQIFERISNPSFVTLQAADKENHRQILGQVIAVFLRSVLY